MRTSPRIEYGRALINENHVLTAELGFLVVMSSSFDEIEWKKFDAPKIMEEVNNYPAIEDQWAILVAMSASVPSLIMMPGVAAWCRTHANTLSKLTGVLP